MRYQILTGVVAVALLVAFILPIVIKMKEISLGIVVLIGVALMLRDLWESVTDRDC